MATGDPQTIKKRDTVKELISSGASVHCTSYSGTDGGSGNSSGEDGFPLLDGSIERNVNQ